MNKKSNQKKPKYRFLHAYAPHSRGDTVPDTYTVGMVKTMLESRRIEPIPDTASVRVIESAPADKMMRPVEVHRKGGGE